jgi:hypothetical protein
MPKGDRLLQVSDVYLCINTVPHLICGPCVQGLPQYVSSRIILFSISHKMPNREKQMSISPLLPNSEVKDE